ncbi:hypothetical protein MRX96_040587 [Rhipicephalus microplus]
MARARGILRICTSWHSTAAYDDFLQFVQFSDPSIPCCSFFGYSLPRPTCTSDPSHRFPVWKTSSRHVFHIDVTLEYYVGLQHFGNRFSVDVTLQGVYHTGPSFSHYWRRFFDASAVAFSSQNATVRATRSCSPVHDIRGLVHARLVLSPSHRSRLHVVCFEGFLTDVHGACRSHRYR